MRRKDIKDKPTLRFGEFSENLQYKSFGQVLIKKSRPVKMGDDFEYRLVTVKRGYGGVVPRGNYKGREILVKSQFKLEANDFLISKRQICHNACGIVPAELEGSIVSNEYTIFAPRKGVDIKYILYFCNKPIVSHTFYLSSIGVHIEKMLFKVEDWLKWEFSFPSLMEQQKIASFLSAVDTKIAQLTRKKELLEQYKKGVMQKIFSQEIRFKDDNGQDYPGWEDKKIRNIGQIITGNTPATSKADYYNGGERPFVSPFDIRDDSRYIASTKTKVTDLGFKSGRKIIEGSILFVCIGSTIGKIGQNKFSCITNQQINSVVINKDNDSNFVFSSLEYHSSKIKCLAGEQAVPIINKTTFGNYNMMIPCLMEQKKIGSFMLMIDKKLNIIQTQLTQTQNFKKGLLQKMFV